MQAQAAPPPHAPYPQPGQGTQQGPSAPANFPNQQSMPLPPAQQQQAFPPQNQPPQPQQALFPNHQQQQQQNPQFQLQHPITAAQPLNQNQYPMQPLGGNEPGGPSGEVEVGEEAQDRPQRKQAKWANRNLWVSGQSVVGRKGQDGEWMEVRCAVM